MYKKELRELLQGFVYDEIPSIQVSGLSLDSRTLKTGDAYLALVGEQFDGNNFIEEAIAKGASVIITEKSCSKVFSVPCVYIPNLRVIHSHIAANFYDDPSHYLEIIGVTGTNGKSSIVYLLTYLLNVLGRKSALIGTLGFGNWQTRMPLKLTTPDAIFIQNCLQLFKQQGIQEVVMEISSHGLAQHRVDAINFNYGIFTNLTQDHLDYHINMENYGKSKERFFLDFSLDYAVIYLDDPFGKKLINKLPKSLSVISYGKSFAADVKLKEIRYMKDGMEFEVSTPWGRADLKTNLYGEYNAFNLLAILSVLCLKGYSLEEVLPLLETLPAVPGRLQCVTHPKGNLKVFIDYAHTPDALLKVLQTVKSYTDGQVWCVFGCGGNRDRTKRPLMGRYATDLADRIILTSDNPRSEAPEDIVKDIMSGMIHKEKTAVELDRKNAIYSAILQAEENDTILVAGKGHENEQIIGQTVFKFNDQEMVLEAMNKRYQMRITKGK